MTELRLHGYFRSTAAWRVRIAMNLKGIGAAQRSYHLRRGDQRGPEYLRLNPQGLVPTLEIDGAVLTQSLSIIEYLEETHPEPPVLPRDPLDRARVRAFALAIACDIHPIQNLRVLRRLRKLGHSEEDVFGWARETIEPGLEACAALIAEQPGPFCFGAAPTLADICLVPQLGNARRFEAKADYGRLLDVEAACMALPAFQDAVPERQPDAE
ncbi:MAG TPA: maleylacetoacetate isomerase [Acetobacteraceae bacterium]|nr:maleylacetoacetate isomerase [Acetobacteraceae bacterium]